MGCLYKRKYLKIQLCLKMWFSTLFDITWCVEAAIYEKTFYLSFYTFFSEV